MYALTEMGGRLCEKTIADEKADLQVSYAEDGRIAIFFNLEGFFGGEPPYLMQTGSVVCFMRHVEVWG